MSCGGQPGTEGRFLGRGCLCLQEQLWLLVAWKPGQALAPFSANFLSNPEPFPSDSLCVTVDGLRKAGLCGGKGTCHHQGPWPLPRGPPHPHWDQWLTPCTPVSRPGAVPTTLSTSHSPRKRSAPCGQFKPQEWTSARMTLGHRRHHDSHQRKRETQQLQEGLRPWQVWLCGLNAGL